MTSGDNLSFEHSFVQNDWAFPESEITLTETVIGRGAFGEVRVAKWRNIDVAAKRLHGLYLDKDSDPLQAEQSQSIIASFRSEMSTLSKLRHPNLLLFLGICYNSRTHQPSTILTELMPCSLYDVLENFKTKLTLPEILDIAHDIGNGLEYLHSRSPPIVHRDISAKNILIGGNKAKIADLGQAKIFGATALSRQTSMPGAMAYSAPEVLTGKYTVAIDIFSFGVLLVQMCCLEYPRIERREEQLRSAVNRQPPLENLLITCMGFQPSERPTSLQICSIVKTLKSNDRHYPPARRLSPQRDIGVLARRWMNENIESQCKDVKLSLEQTSRRLDVEEQRWRDEAARVDRAEKRLAEVTGELMSVKTQLQSKEVEVEQWKQKHFDIEVAHHSLQQVNRVFTGEIEMMQESIDSLNSKIQSLQSDVASKNETIESTAYKLDTLKDELSALKISANMSATKEKDLKFKLDMQLDESRELEVRLEQALTRWKQEKENLKKEYDRCLRMTANNAELVDKNQRLAQEVERLSRRLRMYDALPLPEEIKARLADLEEDVKRGIKEKEILLDQKTAVESEVVDLNRSIEELRGQVNSLNVTIADMNKAMGKKDEYIANMEMETTEATDKVAEAYGTIETLENEKRDLIRITDELRNEVQEAALVILALKKSKKPSLPTNVDSQDSDAVSSDDDVDYEASEEKLRVGEEAYDRDEVHRTLEEEVSALRRFSVNTRLQVVRERDSAEANATFRQRAMSRFHRFGGANIADLATAASKTKEALDSMSRIQTEGYELDALEKKREKDNAAKLQVAFTLEHTGAKGLIKLLWDNLDNEYIAWRAARSFRDAIIKDDTAKQNVINEKCESVLYAVLTAFPRSILTQAQCFRTIAALAFGSDQFRRHSGEKGIIKKIVLGMDMHMTDESVLLHACTAVTNLCHNSVDNRGRFVEAGGPEMLITCMDVHTASSPKLLRQACWAVLTLAGSDDVARVIVNMGGNRSVTTAMMNHRYDGGVQQFACWALSNLALAGEDIRRKLRKAGVVEMCKIALETHPDDIEVVRQARNTIGVLGPLPNKPVIDRSKSNVVENTTT